jgi:hypothetical protein
MATSDSRGFLLDRVCRRPADSGLAHVCCSVLKMGNNPAKAMEADFTLLQGILGKTYAPSAGLPTGTLATMSFNFASIAKRGSTYQFQLRVLCNPLRNVDVAVVGFSGAQGSVYSGLIIVERLGLRCSGRARVLGGDGSYDQRLRQITL